MLPKSVQLAITAALEHYTATLAETLLVDEEAREILDLEEVRSLFVWHALEESEHKAVAFDVYQHVSGSYGIRKWVMNATTFGFLAGVGFAALLSLVTDRAALRQPRQTLRSIRNLRHSPWLSKEVAARIRDYNRRDFHPDDYDNAALTAEWRERLFGANGTLKASLRNSGP